jgi:hypothetical protein
MKGTGRPVYVVAACAVCAVCLVCLAAAGPSHLHFESRGFSIDELDSGPGEVPHQTMLMFLPPSEGFAANVNVQIHPFKGTIKQYAVLSQQQFAASKFKVLKATSTEAHTVRFEYTGTVQGRNLHWYVKAISNGRRVYLATASAKEEQWEAVAEKLKACVDSLALDGDVPAKAPKAPAKTD